MRRGALLGCVAGAVSVLIAVGASATEAELGRIRWGTDLARGRDVARRTGKPMLLLSTRVPGGADAKLLGAGALSHPVVVDAAHNEFVLVADTGADDGARRVKAASGDPSIRFLNANGDELAPTVKGAASAGDVLESMVTALEKSRRQIPEYLALVAWGYNPGQPKKAVFTFT